VISSLNLFASLSSPLGILVLPGAEGLDVDGAELL